MTTEFQVSLYEGKYTYERDDDGQQRALRYGEPWRDLVGDKFVAAMGYEIERLQVEVARVEGQRNASNRHIEKMTDTLAAAQAREARLQEALMDATAHLAAVVSAYDKFVGRADQKGHRDALFVTRFSDFKKAEERARSSLNLPHDDTALKERLAQERERIAERFEQLESPWITKEAASALVRNLGDEA